MALQFIQTPNKFTPAYNEQMFLTSGITSGKNNYQYIFGIYNAAGTRIVPYIKIPPRVSDSWAAFDAHRIVEAYLTSDIQILGIDGEGFKTNDNSYFAYTVKVGEEYDTSTTGVTSYPDLVTSSGTVYAFNGAYPFQDFNDYNQNTRLGISSSSKLMSSTQDIVTSDSYKKIWLNESEWNYAMTDTANAYSYAVLLTYENGAQQGAFKISNPFAALATTQSRFVRFPVGTRNLNRIPSGSIAIIAGTLPMIRATTEYYYIGLVNAILTGTAQAMAYSVTDNYNGGSCTNYDKYRLHFLNKFGGFDSFTFYRVSRVNESIERKTYKKLAGSTSGRWSTNSYDRGAVVYNTSITDRLTLDSDWVSQAESEWLEQLIVSPEVYWDNNDELQAITITDTSYEKKKTVNDKLFNLRIEVEISQKRFTQRG